MRGGDLGCVIGTTRAWYTGLASATADERKPGCERGRVGGEGVLDFLGVACRAGETLGESLGGEVCGEMDSTVPRLGRCAFSNSCATVLRNGDRARLGDVEDGDMDCPRVRQGDFEGDLASDTEGDLEMDAQGDLAGGVKGDVETGTEGDLDGDLESDL